jgi:hypothetical protein
VSWTTSYLLADRLVGLLRSQTNWSVYYASEVVE